ncbi:RRNA adenine N(6)-methyltransferase [Fusarium keratoplasticum]|uniref:rRNA adenine N(6)-methyltransferase n=1 Tax=Fusarium keratoplasticum TaxID=1328300 RepID=A0ACC0QUZ9_9HYPO|nr:RRNA adenine N(6)-methyltransferase [Fusarium keratoplasticum]KAI8668689.1 RRNA adenine N(6)-methyltransferase [Fusarium keratoplasticum]KAI8673297.1 RRNA adenine N(6)-methyltransferase [Fusarium keratoplasticum]
MFLVRRHNARKMRPFLRARANARKQSTRVTEEMLVAGTPVAERLKETGLWKWQRGRRVTKGVPVGDKHRVNIVSEKLCDDIANYIGPSLDRHRGCDLIDINPGAGLWSRTLHDLVQPRKHILMEPDVEVYGSMLSDLIERPGVQLLPKAGILWREVNDMLATCISPEKKADPNAVPERNDTLLVNINMSFAPPKKFQMFECVSTMVLYQLMSSIKTASLFQQYGLVRMLIWVNDDSKRRLVPHSATRRKRSTFEAELSCEWIREIAGKDVEFEAQELRDEWINLESGYNTLARMKKAGLTMPSDRETFLYKTMMADESLMGQKLAGVRRPILSRPFRTELEGLESEFASSKEEEPSKRLKALRYRGRYDIEDSTTYHELIQQGEAASQIWKTDPAAFAAADAAWNAKIQLLKKNNRKEYVIFRDNYHIFRQDPPLLHWDRRPFEPLDVRADEFYPQVPCALLDLQPKTMHKYLRQHGPTAREGSLADAILRFWYSYSLYPVSKAMDSLWPGFGKMFPEITCLRDPAKGGSPLSGDGEMPARCVNEKQWTEIVETFLNWPFVPEYQELVGRMMDESEGEDEDDAKSGATGAGGVGGSMNL